MRGLPRAFGVAVAAPLVVMLAGCEGSKPLTADGPNQYVFKVPSMT